MFSDKIIHRAFRTHTTLYTNPFREIFHFHHLPKLYIRFNLVRFQVQSLVIITFLSRFVWSAESGAGTGYTRQGQVRRSRRLEAKSSTKPAKEVINTPYNA